MTGQFLAQQTYLFDVRPLISWLRFAPTVDLSETPFRITLSNIGVDDKSFLRPIVTHITTFTFNRFFT